MSKIKTDSYYTRKFYPKLDAYGMKGDKERYIGSSCQFRSMRRFKAYLHENLPYYATWTIEIRKGQE